MRNLKGVGMQIKNDCRYPHKAKSRKSCDIIIWTGGLRVVLCQFNAGISCVSQSEAAENVRLNAIVVCLGRYGLASAGYRERMGRRTEIE